jgi:aminoglycoside phosphotransferase (APT) family kinase protein
MRDNRVSHGRHLLYPCPKDYGSFTLAGEKINTEQIDALKAFLTSFAPDFRLREAWTLQGGVSATMIGLEVVGPGNDVRQLVVRQHGPQDLAVNPDVALDEFRLLQALVTTDIPVPKPLHLDQTGGILSVPALVLEFVDGSTIFDPVDVNETVWDLAEVLALIHSIRPSHLDVKFLPRERQRNEDRLANPPSTLDVSLQEDRIRHILSERRPLRRVNEDRLLHGDYWPGNVLWKDKEIIAVIDWENAQIGDPVEDLANARLEILWAYGYEAMETFTAHYTHLRPIDYSDLPLFDLLVALRPTGGRLAAWGIEPLKEQAMRNGHRLFVDQAIQALGL